ncbi:MAG: hypothetical protein II875_14055 [Clostridia bacterium]|nr:hypothetical protein [Clostridia bacterium]
MTFYYTADETGVEDCSDQSIDAIQITVRLTEQGIAKFKAEADEEAALRAEGKIRELYQGNYEIGKDLPSGNYELSLISTSCSVYVYNNKTSFENNKGDWKYLYGNDDREYLYLTEGMYLKVSGGATEAKIRDVKLNDSECLLYTGVYQIGVDLDAGSYELRPYTDASSVYLYQTVSNFKNNKDGKWMYLYGKDDKEYLSLRDGMVLKVSSGATLAKKK